MLASHCRLKSVVLHKWDDITVVQSLLSLTRIQLETLDINQRKQRHYASTEAKANAKPVFPPSFAPCSGEE